MVYLRLGRRRAFLILKFYYGLQSRRYSDRVCQLSGLVKSILCGILSFVRLRATVFCLRLVEMFRPIGRNRAPSLVADGRASPFIGRARANSFAVEALLELPAFEELRAKTPSPPRGIFSFSQRSLKSPKWQEVLNEIDKRIDELAAQERERKDAEKVNIWLEQIFDTEEKKDAYIKTIFEAAKLDAIIDKDSEPLFNDVIFYIIKKYLEKNIDIYTTRRDPDYLILMAASQCTQYWLNGPDLRQKISLFKELLQTAIDDVNDEPTEDNIRDLKTALEIGLGAAGYVAQLLGEGFDISNYDKIVWDCPPGVECTVKYILEHNLVPQGIIDQELAQKRYAGCSDFYKNPAVQNALSNKNGSALYNRMRRLTAAGGKRIKRVNRRKTRRTKR